MKRFQCSTTMRSFTAVLRNTTVCARLGPGIEKENVNGLGNEELDDVVLVDKVDKAKSVCTV